MNNLVLTKKHVRRLRRLNRPEGSDGLRPGDVRRNIDAQLIAWGYARRFLPFNLSHRLRTVITQKGRTIVTEKPENA